MKKKSIKDGSQGLLFCAEKTLAVITVLMLCRGNEEQNSFVTGIYIDFIQQAQLYWINHQNIHVKLGDNLKTWAESAALFLASIQQSCYAKRESKQLANHQDTISRHLNAYLIYSSPVWQCFSHIALAETLINQKFGHI